MRIARFVPRSGGVPQYGIVRDETVIAIRGDVFGRWQETRARWPLGDVTLLRPVEPADVFCFGRNYRAHAAEGADPVPETPLMFMKATTSVIETGRPIELPAVAPTQVDWEAELAVVIRQTAWQVDEADALRHVLGYTCANDVSARDCQAHDGQWSRGKSFDTFCPLGPWIETELDPSKLWIEGRLDGEVVQRASTAEMIFSVAALVSFLSWGMTLLPGTVILTGTPAGCGFARTPPRFLRPGDVFEVAIEGIGVLRNAVRGEGPR
jgi:2-keto-4-pentenoate hydratase/2-oxohepta-3-ene-1,7-dioic acid hydratase in catechol pathway